jgi:GNAT superfamily N-acetyltransferase
VSPAGSCECGWLSGSWNIRPHNRWWHPRFADGLPLPKAVQAQGPYLVVPANGASPEGKVAYTMARIAQRAGGYDFASFPRHGRGGSDWVQYRLTAYLRVVASVVVAYCSVLYVSEWARFQDMGDKWTVVERYTGERQPVVNLIFVCKNWRRRGVATELVGRVAADSGLAAKDVVWGLPFSDDGMKLMQAITHEGSTFLGY